MKAMAMREHPTTIEGVRGEEARTIDVTQSPPSELPVLARPLAALRRVLRRDETGSVQGEERRRPITLPSPPSYRLTFILCVVLPSFISLIYFTFLASDQFAAEARFAIRSAPFATTVDSNTSGALSSMGSGGIPSIAGQDAHVVANFIRSPAIFAELDPAVDPKKIFTRPEADFWARLPMDASLETLTDYWREMVHTNVDGPSGIVTVTVRAFRPDDARDLMESIVKASEKLVNTMSQRARNDSMSAAEAEVRRTEALVRDALVELQAYREKVGFIDPVKAAASSSQLLLQTMAEKIKLESDYFVSLRATGSDSPTVLPLKSRIEALDQQIGKLKTQLTGTGGPDPSIASTIARFEELELKRVFSEKLYDFATRAMERARQRAERQNVYLSVFVAPMLPEEARFPLRLSMSILIPIGLLVLWGIGALTALTIEDHTY